MTRCHVASIAIRVCAVASVTVAVVAVQPAAAATTRTIGRIVIPAIRLDATFANGASPKDTAFGPSHYPSTAMPGHRRTVAIAGHRVTHTHPFLHLGELRAGDRIEIRFGRAPVFLERACYQVRRTAVVSPNDVGVIRDLGYDRLVLTTCTPPGFSTYRLVVTARRITCRTA
jgi:sortase A